MALTLFLLLMCLLCQNVVANVVEEEKGCYVDIRSPQLPLIFLDDMTYTVLPTPANKHVLYFFPNQTVEFTCPGSSVMLRGQKTKKQLIRATCIPRFDLTHYKISEITCRKFIRASVHEIYKCAGGGVMYYVDLAVPPRSMQLFKICFSYTSALPLYSHYRLFPRMVMEEELEPNKFYFLIVDKRSYNSDINPFELLKPEYQKKRINELLGLETDSNVYIDADKFRYLIWSYLTPPNDFPYRLLRNIVRRSMNAAPQWYSIFANNWWQVEETVRKFCTKEFVPLQVYTGVSGECKLPNSNLGRNVPLVLAESKEKIILRFHGKMTVPAMFWKIIFIKSIKKAIVFITLNNPYLTDVKDHVICADLSKQTGWIDFDRTNIVSGYTYVCSYSDFARHVRHAPIIDTSGILYFNTTITVKS